MTATHGSLSVRGQRFAAALAGWPRRKVTLLELWRILDEVDPATRMAGSRRQLLIDTLNELAKAQLLDLPASASWDRSETPHLPRFIRLPATPDGTSATADQVVWHPALAWVPDARVPATHRANLIKINRWLHTNRSQLVVPSRERSIEIFGSEKTLDRLLRTSVFGPDRLTLDLLRTQRAAPLFTHHVVGSGTTLLIAENSDTFYSLGRVLEVNPGPVGIVGWGSGGGFEASVLSLPRLPAEVQRVLYFGDLDLRGLQIPASADRTARAEGLPPVEPATSLYEALLDAGAPQKGSHVGPVAAENAAAWLPDHLRRRAVELLTGGFRIAQEHIGTRHLTEDQRWRHGLA